jgi:N-acetylglutamate synthase-like GNAT family acetyltransferase
MLITRASRRDLAAVEEFYAETGFFDGYEKPDFTQGWVFIARQGPVVGAVRLLEVAPQTLVVEDAVVAEARRGEGVGARLLGAAMNNRGGRLFVACEEDVTGFYERLGFSDASFDDLPAEVQAHFRTEGCHPQPGGRVLRYMSAR